MPEINFEPKDEDAILKEVWNTTDIESKTELNDTQIQSTNKLKTLSVIFNSDLLKDHLNDFMILQKSRQRRSMAEFVDSVKAKRQDLMKQGGNFFNNLMG